MIWMFEKKVIKVFKNSIRQGIKMRFYATLKKVHHKIFRKNF